MARVEIPVDVFNPGQVFACLGLLEAAESLLGDAAGGFDWTEKDAGVRFVFNAAGAGNPVETVLEFLAEARPRRWAPIDYTETPSRAEEEAPETVESGTSEDDVSDLELSPTFPSGEGDRMALPVRLGGGSRPVIELGHWADGSSRESFKLYAGNRSADQIVRAMLQGARKRSKDGTTYGRPHPLKGKGIEQLWQENRAQLLVAPFDVLTPIGGSFNFDPRGTWTSIDTGYSPNDQGHAVLASPVVEFLAAWGLENARPATLGVREIAYCVWGVSLPPMLARAALAGGLRAIPSRRFRFELGLSGKNKVITFAEEEPAS